MTDRNPTVAPKLALLIDGDNVSAAYMDVIMREAAKHGAVAVRRIYGQFKAGKMKSWMKHIDAFDLTPVNVSPLTHGKNATDMKLVIEAMDMLYGRQLDGICIASSDGDFTPLAARVRANALAAYGFGAKKAPAAYKAEFDRFYECDTLLAAEKKQEQEKAPATPRPATKGTTRRRRKRPAAPARPAPTVAAKPGKPEVPVAKVLEAIDAATGGNGRAHMRSVGNKLTRAVPGFAAKTYGYRTITDLVRALPAVELTKDGNETYVSRKPT
jgi:NYN domain/OST-HTH/LOTUS domain